MKTTATKLWKTLLVIACMVLASRSAVQAGDEECAQLLRTFYHSFPELSNKYAWVMKYTVSTADWEGNEPQRVTTELAMSGKKMKMVSSEMEVYQDEKSAVTVVPDEKKIYVADRQDNGKTEAMLKTFAMFRDTVLFARCDIRECRDIRGSDGAPLKKFMLVFKSDVKASLQKRYPIASIELVVNTKTNKPYQYTTHFTKDYRLKSLSVTFHDVNFYATMDNVAFRAGEKYLTEQQKLRPAYNSYTVIDVRKTR